MFDLVHLRTLSEVRRCGSFSGAAQRLAFTPSAVSQQMAVLEREAGTRLFEREGRGIRLTDAGRSLAVHAERVLATVADARTDLDRIADGRGGRLRLGSFPSATSTFVAHAIATFRERFPHVELTYVSGEPYELLPMLRRRELDLAVVFAFDRWPAGRDYEGKTVCPPEVAEVEPLFDDPYVLVVPRGHRLARKRRVAIADLTNERIMGNPASGSPWAPDFVYACHRAGVDPIFEDAYHDWDFQSMQAFVATGRGITLLPRLGVGSPHPGVAVKRLERAPVRHVQLATPRSRPVSAVAARMRDVLVEAVGGDHAVPAGLAPPRADTA